MSSTSPAKPPIRAGQSWLTRDNSIAFIYSTTNPDSVYPILARVYEAVKAAETNDYIRRDLSSTADFHRVSYTPEGHWIDGSEDPIDLSTLVSDASPDASPDASEAAKPQLRVGQVWRDRNGDLHTIVEDDGTEIYPCRSNRWEWFTYSGNYYDHGAPSDCDLIELVHDVSRDASEALDPAPSTGEATAPFSFRTAIHQVADGAWPDALATAQAESDAAEIFVGLDPYAATVFATNPTANNAIKPNVIAINHGPDVVSRVMSDGSAWYAPTHRGIPTGPWTRYAD